MVKIRKDHYGDKIKEVDLIEETEVMGTTTFINEAQGPV